MNSVSEHISNDIEDLQAIREARRQELRNDPFVAEILEMDGSPKIIGEVADEFGVTFRALRHYEVKGLLSPVMTPKGRMYDRKDQVRLKLLLEGKKWGLELKIIKKILDLYNPQKGCIEQVQYALAALSDQRQRLETERMKIDRQIGLLKKALKEGPQVIQPVAASV